MDISALLGKIAGVADCVTTAATKGKPGPTLGDLENFLGNRHSCRDDCTAAEDAEDADMAYAMAESRALAAKALAAKALAAKAVAVAKDAKRVAAVRAAIAKRTEAAERDAFQRGVEADTAAKDAKRAAAATAAKRAAATTAKRSAISPCLDCASLRQMVEHLTVQIAELQKQNETQCKEIAGLRSMRRQYSELQGVHGVLQQQLQTVNREKEILRRSNAEKDESIERLKRQVDEQMGVMRAMGIDV